MELNMPESIELKVHIAFDAEAQVWYVGQSDIPGLRLEADDPFNLMKRLQGVAEELIEANLREILAKHARPRSVKIQSAARPPMSMRPVFDNAVQLALA